MKTLKSLLMLCAGLSFCACGSDNEPQFPEGTGIVEVKIVAPTTATRAITSGTTTTEENNKLTVTGTYTVTLDAVQGGRVIDDFNPKTADGGVAKFTGVVGPKSVTVSLNGGVKDYSTVDITTLNTKDDAHIEAAAVPAYGETTTFTDKSTTTDAQGNVTKTFGATVQMAIPVARLEIGTITLETSPEQTKFSKLHVAGVYLDKLRDKGGKYTTDKFVCQATSPTQENPYAGLTDYQWGATENQFGKGIKYVLGDAADVDLKEADAVLPTSGKVYAYNFYGATNGGTDNVGNPQFKIYFDQTKLAAESTEAAAVSRFAMITSYRNGDDEIKLENGKIYQITAVELLDTYIVDDEENKTVQYNVEVTVKEAQWELVTTTGVWAGSN